MESLQAVDLSLQVVKKQVVLQVLVHRQVVMGNSIRLDMNKPVR
jgi:hypothetical protein